MTPPDDFSSAAIAVTREAALIADAPSASAAPPAPYGRIHAVPVVDILAHSSPVLEVLYRVFEIVVALIGLIVGLPIMLVEAALIRWDSPGPAMFFHQRPGRSIIWRGRDLE